MIDLYEEQNPGVTIVPEFSDFGGYWDKLATTTAGGDMPDVFQMDEKYLLTYADRGALLDLNTLDSLDTSGLDPDALATGELDGSLYGLVNAVNTYAILVNTTMLDELGIDVPDDETWTWDEFAQIAQRVTEATESGTYGMQQMGIADGDLDLWARQLGETQWTTERGFGVSEDTLVGWWEYVLDLEESGAMPSPEIIEERNASGVEGSSAATNRAAFSMWWANQYTAVSRASGDDLVLMRPPRHESGGESGLHYKPSQFWSASATTEHPEEVGKFIDFINNSPEAGEILLVDRGVPSNLDVRAHITPLLEDEGRAYVAYIDAVADDIGEAAPVTPPGAADYHNHLTRYTYSVLFGQETPREAAQGLIGTVDGLIE